MKKKGMILFFVLLLLCGCANQNIEVTEPKTVTETVETISEVSPKSGGTLYLSMRTTQTLNPLTNEDATVDRILKLVYAPLITFDEDLKPAPSIAESWTYSEDGRTLSISLKQDIYWSDGTNVTAEDVIFSMNAIRASSENSVYKKCMQNVVGFSRDGNYRVTVTFNRPFSGNIYSMCFPVICAHYYGKDNIVTSTKNLEPMGNGPFQFKSFTPAKELRLVKSENSFGKVPYIDEICVIISPDESTDLYSFDQGLTDSVSANITEMGKYDATKKTKRFEYTTNYYDFIGFNFNRSMLQDKNVRKAIAYCIPKENILESVYLNHAEDAATPVNPNSWLYEDDVQKYHYDLSHAKVLLEESGWADSDNDKIRDRNINEFFETLKVSILVNEENEERRQIAVRLADEMKTIGFDVSIDVEPFEIYTQKLQERDYDIFVGGWQFSVVPDYSFMFHSNEASDGTNYASYKNEQMDQLLNATYAAVQEEDVKTAYSNFQKYAAEEIPYISLVFRNSALFTNKRIYGEIQPLENNIYNNVNEWFIEEAENNNK